MITPHNHNKDKISDINKIIQNLYIIRYKLIKNAFSTNVKKGHLLVFQNNKHFDEIMHDMKKIIKTIQNVKKYKFEIMTNITYYEYDYFYNPKINYEDIYIYKGKEENILKSLYFGINNFIYYIFFLLKNDDFKKEYMLNIQDIYEKLEYNLNVLNLTIDNREMRYKDNKDIDLNKKLKMSITIKYDIKHKTTVENFNDYFIDKLNNKTILDIDHKCKKFLFKNITIYEQENNNVKKLVSVQKEETYKNILINKITKNIKKSDPEIISRYYSIKIILNIKNKIFFYLNYIYFFDLWKKLNIPRSQSVECVHDKYTDQTIV